MAVSGAKTGRRANADEREAAQMFADAYRRGEVDGEFLCSVLEAFAREGTMRSTMDLRPIIAKAIARELGDGATFAAKQRAVMDHFHVSEATAARLLRGGLSKRGTD
jgi:hypothetical protein